MTLDDIVAKVTDPYDRQARLYPVLLCLLPLLTFVALLYPPNASALTRVVTIAASCGGLFLMTNICREMGERLEDRLCREWGGKPTTQLLRHHDDLVGSGLCGRERYRSCERDIIKRNKFVDSF
jgi:hypothetical protein